MENSCISFNTPPKTYLLIVHCELGTLAMSETVDSTYSVGYIYYTLHSHHRGSWRKGNATKKILRKRKHIYHTVLSLSFKNPFEWTHTVQTCVVQGSAVFQTLKDLFCHSVLVLQNCKSRGSGAHECPFLLPLESSSCSLRSQLFCRAQRHSKSWCL